MKTSIVMVAAMICAGPAFADTANNVTLVIENDAGMVTQLPDMTQRECDAVAGMLAPRKVAQREYTIGTSTGTLYLGGVTVPPKSATSKLTTSKCVVQTQ